VAVESDQVPVEADGKSAEKGDFKALHLRQDFWTDQKEDKDDGDDEDLPAKVQTFRDEARHTQLYQRSTKQECSHRVTTSIWMRPRTKRMVLTSQGGSGDVLAGRNSVHTCRRLLCCSHK
jgi:hypothetical protein